MLRFSNEDIPDAAYIFLSKGLGYTPPQKVNLQDLRHDMTEFIMKLTFFTAKPKIDSGNRNSGDVHQDIRVSGFTHPDFTTPILEKAKIKLFSWVANHTASNPKSNLSPIEMRGRIWLLDKIEEGRLLVKADKGGAILIMNPRCFNLQVPNPTKQNKRK